MSGTTDGPDHMDSVRQLPPTEGTECEARLRHVLAYISEKRHRMWTAFTAVFLLIFHLVGIPFNILIEYLLDALELAGLGVGDVFGSPDMFGLVLLVTTLVMPLTITLLIFSRLRRFYRGH